MFVEIVTEKIGDRIVCSYVREATKEEAEDAMRLYENGECDHRLVKDERGWMYDIRSCALCGKGVGLI